MTQEFWDLAPLSVYHDGVELTQLISEDSDPKLPLWLPDLFFPDSLNVEASAQLLKLRPGMLYDHKYMRCFYQHLLYIRWSTVLVPSLGGHYTST